MLRSIVDWFKRLVIETAVAELSAEWESAGAVAVNPPALTVEHTTPASEKAKGAKGRKTAGK